ncbi:MAG: hypothetical protein BRD55_05555 [Bacteroidetes bacterium SW_9_63_38]|nr:MAG: hypothetical protein BRD55_05555 [Bacteroidetes bacterium SW_9_63_38]
MEKSVARLLTTGNPKWLLGYSVAVGMLGVVVSAWGAGRDIDISLFVGALFCGLSFLVLISIRIERIVGKTRTAALKSSERAAVAQAMPLVYDRFDLSFPVPTLDEWTLEPGGLLLLHRLIEGEDPSVIVELGSGASTPVLAHLAEKQDRRFTSIENDDSWVEVTRQRLSGWDIEPDHILHHVPLADNPFQPSAPWYDTDGLDDIFGDETIDLIFVDGPAARHGTHRRQPAFTYFASRMSPGGILVLDDYNREDEQEVVDFWKQEMPEIEVSTFSGRKSLAVVRMPE